MKNLQTKLFVVFTIFCVLAIVSSCGGGGGGGGMGGSSGASGVEVVPATDVSSSNNTSYGFSKNSIVVNANSGTSELKTPAFLKNAKVQPLQPNKSAKGEGIYSEALKQAGIVQINLILTIDGVTSEYNLKANDALVLKQVSSGTKIVASGTVQTADQKTRNIVQKEYDIEAFQDTLPLFVEYNATLKDKDGNDLENFVYSTDKPIELPVLNDITVENAAGDALGVAPFLGWQVSAQGLSIDKNFYAKGVTVPAGELCGDIEFYADYGFCVYQDTDTIIEDAGLELFAGSNAELYFADVNSKTTTFDSANVTNPAVATFEKEATTGEYTLTAKAVGNTTFTVTGKSLRGNNYTVQIPVTVEEFGKFVKIAGETITGQPDWATGSKVFIAGRTVEIPTLWACDHEVTQGEYQAVMGSNPSTATTDGDASKNPVNNVSWYNALVYCNKRSKNEGLTPCYTIKGSTDPNAWGAVPTSNNATWNAVTCDFDANGYRLPTEAEWEYLARGKEAYTYSGSDDIEEVAWYDANSNSKTHEVGTKKANAFGLYDMSGNVREWCWDWYTSSITTSTPSTGPASGSGRVLRGGSWYDNADCATVSYRYGYNPCSRYDFIGFRVVRSSSK